MNKEKPDHSESPKATGIEAEETRTADRVIAFGNTLSYGHDAYSVLAERLKKDLEAQGYEVWYDLQRLKAGVDWEQYIEEGLEKASRMADQGFLLFLMTLNGETVSKAGCI